MRCDMIDESYYPFLINIDNSIHRGMFGKETRGGSRSGSGRKSVNLKVKRVQTTISVAPGTRDKIRFLAKEKNIRIGRIIDQVVDDIYNSDK